MTIHTDANRRTRVDEIRDAAIVCRLVGIAATHRRLVDGRHGVSI